VIKGFGGRNNKKGVKREEKGGKWGKIKGNKGKNGLKMGK